MPACGLLQCAPNRVRSRGDYFVPGLCPAVHIRGEANGDFFVATALVLCALYTTQPPRWLVQ